MKKWLLGLCVLMAPVTSYAGTASFTPDDLPHNISYPAFLQEELFFVPESSEKDAVKSMMDLSGRQVLVFTPAIHTQNIGDFYQIDTSLKGYNTAFYENILKLHADFNIKTNMESSIFSISSNIRRFEMDKGVPVGIAPRIGYGDSFFREDANPLKDVHSEYHFDIVSRHHNENGFDTVTIGRETVSYKGHFEVFITTGYSKGLSGEYVLHLSFDAPSMQNRPQ